MNRPAVAGLLLAVTLAALLGSRLPDAGWQAWGAIALAAGATAIWAISLRHRHPWWTPVLFVVLAALFLLPVSMDAVLARLPPVLAALPAAAFLHASYRDRVLEAPRLPSDVESSVVRRATRFLPLSVALAAVALLPLIAVRTLPDRLASLHELRGALGPILVAVAVLLAILGATWLRDALTPGDDEVPAMSGPEADP